MANRASTVKLQVPMNDVVFSKLKQQSEELGFDSVQAYVRYWAQAAVDGRAFTGSNDGPDLTLPEVQAVKYIELMLTTRHNKPGSLNQALEQILRDLKRINYKKTMESLL